MSEAPFQIPGLGQLPAAPGTVAAAASVGSDQVAPVAANEAAIEPTTTERVTQARADELAAPNVAQVDGVDSNGTNSDDKLSGATTASETHAEAESNNIARMDTDPAALESANHGAPTEVATTNLDPTQAVENMSTTISDGSDSDSDSDSVDGEDENGNAGPDEEDDDHPEWEIDSDPYVSESESDDDDSDEDYPLLGPMETLKILLNENEDGPPTKPGKPGSYFRTKNEGIEKPLPKPEVEITPDIKLELVGPVKSIVGFTVVIESVKDGESQVLDQGTVLCKDDRTVVGALCDTIAVVKNPHYIVNFETTDEIKDLGLQPGTPIYYPVGHAQFVFTRILKQERGTDASNIHDEEVGPDEMDFSDDEKEAEFRRAQKKAKRGGKPGNHGTVTASSTASSDVLKYDDEDDGPYTPLARPSILAQGVPESLPPRPDIGTGNRRGSSHQRGSYRGRRGDHRGGRNQRGDHRGGNRSTTYDREYRGPTSNGSQTQPHLPPAPYNVPQPPRAGHWNGSYQAPAHQVASQGVVSQPQMPYGAYNFPGWNNLQPHGVPPLPPPPTLYPPGAQGAQAWQHAPAGYQGGGNGANPGWNNQSGGNGTANPGWNNQSSGNGAANPGWNNQSSGNGAANQGWNHQSGGNGATNPGWNNQGPT